MEALWNFILITIPYLVLLGLIWVIVRVVQLFGRVETLETRIKKLERKEK